MKQLFFSAIILSPVLFFFSCSKEGSNPPTPQQIDSVKIFGVDSSELVKSVTRIWTDSTGVVGDSSTAYLYYDTVNRKIFIAPTPISGPNPANYAYTLAYNSSYQISHFSTNPALLQDTSAAANIDFTYDNEHVISSYAVTYANGSKDFVTYPKTILPSGGYSLLTVDGYDNVSDTNYISYKFGATGTLLSMDHFTNTTFNRPWRSDSLIYDVAGNITTVFRTDSFYTSPVNLFQMSSRATKGNELSTLNRVLYNGISQFNSDFDGFENFFLVQFTEFPASSVTVYRELMSSYVTFSPNAQFDSKNRLTSLKMYNGDEGTYYYETVKLDYYK